MDAAGQIRNAVKTPMKIAVFFVGEVNDAGFNASALDGANIADKEGHAELTIVSGVRYDQDEIRHKLSEVISSVDGLIFVGGQGNMTTPELANAFPDKKFAVVQGLHTAPNLAAYDVRQEDSAFLAGVLAAQLTQTRTVGHLSGHRVAPGLKGRAAFAAGVAHADPAVRVLSSFCGTQDDSEITRAWASAQIESGADILFTMLNGARPGAIAACRAKGARQIGNALDWVSVAPDVFVASAIARIDLGVKQAIMDMVAGVTPDRVVEFGLADGDYVSLSMSKDIPETVRKTVAQAALDIRIGRITIPRQYAGTEFEPENVPCPLGG